MPGIDNSCPPLHDLSEALDRARQGDEDGVRVLYRWLNPPLLRYLRYHAAPVAEDLASEVWLGVARSVAEFVGGPVELRSLVFAIGRRRVIDHRRHEARQVSTVPIDGVDEPPARASAEDIGLERMMGQRAVEMLVRDLPAEQAEIVLLRVLGDLGVAEVASILGKSEGAVRVAQHRALRRLNRNQNESGVTL